MFEVFCIIFSSANIKMKLIYKLNQLSKVQKYSIFLSLLILIISLTQPAFYIDRPENPAAWAESWMLFLLGWMFLFGGGITGFLFWCANPIYIIGLILIIRNNKSGFWFSLIATLISFGFSLIDEIVASSSGSLSKITSLDLGYKLWLSSFIVLTIGTGLNEILMNVKKRSA